MPAIRCVWPVLAVAAALASAPIAHPAYHPLQTDDAAAIARLYDRGDHALALAASELAREGGLVALLASRRSGDQTPSAPAAPGSSAPESAATAASVDEIRRTAARLDSTLISYWVSDKEIFAWVVAPDGQIRAARTLVARAELEKLVADAIPVPGRDTRRSLAELQGLVIHPIREWLPAQRPLTIVPHGPLFRVPFAALPEPSGGYLVERHAIGYAPSITTLSMTSRRARELGESAANAPYVLVADPVPLPAVNPPLTELPAARHEAETIRQILGDRRVSLLASGRAAEPAVRQAAADARVLHVAAHGVILDDEPFDSFLALGIGGAGQAADGRLTVRELYDLRLQAELVVMSGVHTASGPPTGDGLSALCRALFEAGTPTVLTTLWAVGEEPAAVLMGAFYRHWQKGWNKRDALWRAQLDLLKELREGTVQAKTRMGLVRLQEQPFYWAPYVLVGEP